MVVATPAGPVWDSTTQAPNMGGRRWSACGALLVPLRSFTGERVGMCFPGVVLGAYCNVRVLLWGWWCVAGAPAHGGRGPSPDRLRPTSDDVRCVQIYGCSESHERGFGEIERLGAIFLRRG